jgi:hypothetical protein
MKLWHFLFPKYSQEVPFWRVFIHFWAIVASWFVVVFCLMKGIRLLVNLIYFHR